MNSATNDPDGAGDEETAAAELSEDRFVGGHDLATWNSRLGSMLAWAVQWVSSRVGPRAALVITLLVGALLAVMLTAASAEVYEAVVEGDGVAALDHPLLTAAMTLRSPGLDVAVTANTNVGGVIGMPILAMIFLVIISLNRRSWTPTILIAGAAAGSLLMTVAGKQLIGRARPPLSDAVPPFEFSPSFPSGHALYAVVIAGVIAYVLILRQTTPRARALTIVAAVFFALTIGLSRVYLGHHWFTDVLVAWTLGLAWLALVITAHRLYLTARRRTALSGTSSPH